MLTKRIIPCLDVKEGRVVKGISFVQLRDAGDPVELAKFYDEQGADELVFLDISASHEGRKTMIDVVKEVASELAIPFTVGGGINSLEDMKKILRAGADKVSLNTAAVCDPNLLPKVPIILDPSALSLPSMPSMMKRVRAGRCTHMAAGN